MRIIFHRFSLEGFVYPDTPEGASRAHLPWRPRLAGRTWPNTREGIEAFFLDVFQWSGVYHFLVDEDGGKQWADLDRVGAHAAPFNRGSWGVAALGRFHEQEPSSGLWGLAVDLVARMHWSESTHPDMLMLGTHCLVGHGELPGIVKDCPGGHWPMGRFRRDVGGRLAEITRDFGNVPPHERRALLGWR